MSRFAILLMIVIYAPAGAMQVDSLRTYPWIDNQNNLVEFSSKDALGTFMERWKSDSVLVIAHFGDSHVQPDISTSELRKGLFGVKGNGGRGLVFPYSAARTHSAFDYSTRYTGTWHHAKNTDQRPSLPLGVSGVTIRTTDSNASVSIVFRESQSDGPQRIKIFCRRNRESYDLILNPGTLDLPIRVYDSLSESPFLEVDIPQGVSSFTLRTEKTDSRQIEFELYGLSIETTSEVGVRVHTAGISGANYSAILIESLFIQQLRSLKPDLVILDYGTNDYIPGNRIPADLGLRIIEVIRKVRNAAPSASILLTTTQDMNRRGVNMSAGRTLSQMIRQIAKEQDCALYDWYWISGGPKSMSKWVKNGLAQRDNIHLTTAGYKLKGKLLAQGFLYTLKKLEAGETGPVWINRDSLENLQLVRVDSTAKVPAPPEQYKRPITTAEPTGKLIQHRITNGQTLGSIAEKYGVSVSSIRELNGIHNDRIIAGKTLKVVIANTGTVEAANPVNEKTRANQPAKVSTPSKKVVQHTIRSGETLSSIAEKYRISIAELKRINGLRTSRIVAGKILIIELPANNEEKNKT